MADTCLYRGTTINLVIRETPLPGGGRARAEVVEHPGAAAILPLVGDDAVCLVRVYRAAVGQTLLELPAGTLAPGEAPLACARRELREETGYAAARWRCLRTFYPSPGVLSERMHLFVAEGLTPGPPQPEAGEQVTPVVLAWADALSQLADGTIADGKTILGILLWDRLRGASA